MWLRWEQEIVAEIVLPSAGCYYEGNYVVAVASGSTAKYLLLLKSSKLFYCCC
jgi:hypothetical protein